MPVCLTLLFGFRRHNRHEQRLKHDIGGLPALQRPADDAARDLVHSEQGSQHQHGLGGVPETPQS